MPLDLPQHDINKKSPADLLKEIWGYDKFRQHQAEIIDATLQKNDVIAVLPTGGGKSICYQIPALISEGLTLVVSPLIALMKDQINFLKQHNIKAAMLSSEMNRYELIEVFDNIKYGAIKLLYISPERIQTRLFLEKIAELPVNLIAVDEAHCISNWGHNFRPSYLQIAKIKEVFPSVPILALTATATNKILNEIKKNLFLSSPKIFQATFKRKNLSLNIIESFDKKGELVYLLQKNKGSTIVFIRNRKETEHICEYLNELGFNATFYHAKLNITEKNKRQDLWYNDKCQIMVATNAFGMGINKSNVRNVFHLSIPESVESYYQEVGRAGRDAIESKAYLLYNQSDIDLNLNLFKKKTLNKKELFHILSMLYNEYSIGINEQVEEVFNFDSNYFIKKYKIDKKKLLAVTNFLHQSGIIAINNHQKNNFVKLLIKHEELNNLNKEIYIQLVDYIERIPNSRVESVPVDEYLMAKELNKKTEKIKEILTQLHKQGIVDYTIRSSNNIQFLSARSAFPVIDNKPIWKIYEDIQRSEFQRLLDIHYFVKKKNICRNQLILSYFGEFSKEKCGKCDVCLKHEQNYFFENKEIKEVILSVLSTTPKPLSEILHQLNSLPQKKVLENIEELMDAKKIKKSYLNLFHL